MVLLFKQKFFQRSGHARSFVLKGNNLKVTEQIKELVQSTVEDFGYELYDVEYKKEGGEYLLDIIIDKEDGIDLDDCEKVSRAVDPLLDEADLIKDAYMLCVSSPGADRELKKPKDYENNLGKEIDVRLYKAFEGKSKHVGVLDYYDDEKITIIVKNKKISIPREIISVIKQYVSF